MKIIPIGIDKPKRVPLYRNRAHIDRLKDDIVKEHNKKIRERDPRTLTI